MTATAATAAALSVGLAAWAGVRALRDLPVVLRQLFAAAAVEIALLVQVVVALLALGAGHVLGDPWTFWGYVVTALVVLPAAAAWAFVDRSRWSSVVLLVGALTVAVMQVRVMQVWGAVAAG